MKIKPINLWHTHTWGACVSVSALMQIQLTFETVLKIMYEKWAIKSQMEQENSKWNEMK